MGKPKVHESNVGRMRTATLGGLMSVRGFGNNLDIRLAFDDRNDPLANDE